MIKLLTIILNLILIRIGFFFIENSLRLAWAIVKLFESKNPPPPLPQEETKQTKQPEIPSFFNKKFPCPPHHWTEQIKETDNQKYYSLYCDQCKKYFSEM